MRVAAAVLLLAAALAAAAPAGPPVAFVADIKGNVTIEGNGKLAFLAEVAAGTRLLLGSNASVVITYAATGAEFTASGPGEFLVASAEVRAEKGAAPKRRAVAVADPAVIARLSQAATASVRMRGLPAPAPNALQFPVDTRVSTLQPAPRWAHEAGAAGYVLIVSDANGKEVWKGEARPDAKLPVRLSAATRYKWTVRTARGALGEAHFETPSPEALARAERARSAGRTFADRVLHAAVLQEIGASQEAREAWGVLAGERPDLPELAALAR